MKAFKSFIEEGVNDPSIFKAVFLAGGPGSGKSFIVGKTGLPALGFKVINSDDAFERALKKAGLEASPENIYSPKGQEIRKGAKALTKKKLDLALAGRLGLVIDGTGKDYNKIEKQAIELRRLGYDVAMIFVNTDEETAISRNRKRARSLPDETVSKMWKDVQKNLGKFQIFFGNFYLVDNSESSEFQTQSTNVYKKISSWAKNIPKNKAVSDWMSSQSNKKVNEMKSFKSFIEEKAKVSFDELEHTEKGMAYEGSETWEAGYKRRVVKTTKPEHKEKGYNWRIKGKDRPEISIKLYKERPSFKEFTKQMKRVAGHEFGG